jgi:hypothetical protein
MKPWETRAFCIIIASHENKTTAIRGTALHCAAAVCTG